MIPETTVLKRKQKQPLWVLFDNTFFIYHKQIIIPNVLVINYTILTIMIGISHILLTDMIGINPIE